MDSVTKWMYVVLFLITFMGIGMITESWRMVLYPYLFVLSIGFLLSFGRRIKSKRILSIPIASIIIFFALFIWLDLLGWGSPTGGGGSTVYFLGLVPTAAVYLIGVSSTVVIFALFYSCFFSDDKVVVKKDSKHVEM